MRVLINEHDMLEEFGLHLLSVNYGEAECRTSSVNVPGMNGELDCTEVLTGYPTYKNATHKLTFEFKDGKYNRWISKASIVKGLFHGKKAKVMFDSDNYYYDTRVSVDTSKINQYFSQLVIELDAYPYRISTRTSLEPWIWDTFDFEEDFAIDVSEGTAPCTIEAYGDAMPVSPVISCSGDMTMYYNGNAYELKSGDTTMYDIVMQYGLNEFKFTGTGSVSINYRWGRF